MLLQSWTEVTVNSFQSLWGGFIGYLPNILGALIVFLVGWAIAVGLQKLVTQILRALRIDPILEKAGTHKFFEKGGVKMDFAGWIGIFVKWFLVLVFLLAATDILQLADVSIFLRSVLSYIPNIIVAVVVLAVAFWLANILRKIIQASVAASDIKAAAFLGTLTYWSVLIFGLFAALVQLGIAFALLQTLITGLIAMLALAGGLAFGLGGKEQASNFLSKIRKEISE
jgi:small-conductance mechanosensitive channel